MKNTFERNIYFIVYLRKLIIINAHNKLFFYRDKCERYYDRLSQSFTSADFFIISILNARRYLFDFTID